MNNLFFRVAGAGFRVIYKNEDDVRHHLPSYAPFYIAEDGNETGMFQMTVGDNLVSTTPEGKELGQFDSGDAKHGVYALPQGGYLIYISNFYGKLTCALRTNADFSECQASIFGEESDASYGLNNALMIAFAFSGAHHHILLMHSSVTMNSGKGFLFLGKSGTGKSTHSRLWREFIPGSDLLNDDNPAVRFSPEDGTVTVYGTPWSGKTPCYRNEQVPVGGFLRLQQYPENIIQPLPGVQGFATILSSCSTMIWDKPSYDGICNTVNEIAQRVPSFHLRCLPNKEAAELSYSHFLPKAK